MNFLILLLITQSLGSDTYKCAKDQEVYLNLDEKQIISQLPRPSPGSNVNIPEEVKKFIDKNNKFDIRFKQSEDGDGKRSGSIESFRQFTFKTTNGNIENCENPDRGSQETVTIPEEIIDWDDNMCYVSKQKTGKANPSLRNCYFTSERSCCNFIEDQQIGDFYSAFIPEACQGDDLFQELKNFQCLGCDGDTNKNVLKASADIKYFLLTNQLLKKQLDLTGIKGGVFNINAARKAKNGYIKVCSHWLARFWTGQNVPIDEMTYKTAKDALLQKTKIFDDCGVFNVGGNVPQSAPDSPSQIPRPSQDVRWENALKFLEWYSLTMMPNFGFIIIDTMREDWYTQYEPIYQMLKKQDGFEELTEKEFKTDMLGCFNHSYKLAGTFGLIVAITFYVF